jgi:hypothetical protein
VNFIVPLFSVASTLGSPGVRGTAENVAGRVLSR